jgi:DNA-binding transcriptional LysR family regulator
LRDCARGGLTPRIIQEADSDATSLNLVAVGMGIAFVVAPTDNPPLPDVVLRPIRQLNQRLQLALAWNPVRMSMQAVNFIEIVKRVQTGFRRQSTGTT